MDQNQHRARVIGMRKGQPLRHDRDTPKSTVAYFIQSRPAPGQPWQRA